jgi:superfamily II DNA or RNA helicase
LLLALPTGTGKTVIAALVAAENTGRTLVLVHRDELVVIASIQTLVVPRRLARLRAVAQKLRQPVTLVICDEAHNAIAASWRAGTDSPQGD